MEVTVAGILTVTSETAPSKAPSDIVAVPSGTLNSEAVDAGAYLTRVFRSLE